MAVASNLNRKKLEKFGTPFTLLVTLYSFTYVRWQDVIPPLSYLKIPGLLTYGFLVWWLVNGDKKILVREPLLKLVVLFIFLMGFSFFYSVNVSCIFLTRDVFLIVFSCAIPLIFIAATPEKLIAFFRHWVVIHLLVALFSIKNHGRGNGDFLLDENDLALGAAMGIPYAYFLMRSASLSPRWRFICATTALILAVAVIATFSRGGLLGLLSVSGVIWWFSKHRIRNLIIIVVVSTILGGLVIKFAPEGYISRMNTMGDPNNATRVERLRSWEIARVMWKYNPILGVGAGQYKWNTREYERLTSYWINDNLTKTLSGREAHSLYFALLADMGSVGVTLYGLIVIGLFRTLFKIIKLEKLSNKQQVDSESKKLLLNVNQEFLPDAALLARAIIGALVAFFVSGAFISVIYYPHLWLIVGFVVALKNNTWALKNERSLVKSAR